MIKRIGILIVDYNIGVLISGSGSNLNAIINSGINVKFVASNNPHASGLYIAEEANIPIYSWKSLKKLEEEVSKLVSQYNTDLLVLAGFMRLLSTEFVDSMPQRSIINIHPSLLPAFKGVHAVEQALEYGVKYTGVTVHYVDEGIDSGSIIDQTILKITKNDTPKTLHNRIQVIEHELYSSTIKRILNEKKENL
jgi:phosphoribosylglycinamide formyltransferase-1